MDKITVPEKFEFLASACHLQEPCYSVKATVKEDLGRLMPFLNSAAQPIQYEPGEDPVMIFRLDGYKIALRSHEITIASFSDRSKCAEVLSAVVGFLNQVWQKRNEITPDFRPRRRPPALEIYKLMPGTNCLECGETACMAFAVKLSLGRLEPSLCPFLRNDPENMEKVYNLLGLDKTDLGGISA